MAMAARFLVGFLCCFLVVVLGTGCGQEKAGKNRGADKPVPVKKAE